MANYPLMIYYFSTVDKDIRIINDHPGSKTIVKQLIKLQEYTRNEWAKVHSIVKSMNNNTTPEESYYKSQQITTLCFNINLTINTYYDKIVEIALKKKRNKKDNFL
jgi:hypothetical protein